MAILLILVIFPLKFPLKPKNFTDGRRKGRTSKTKTVLKIRDQIPNFVKIRNTLPYHKEPPFVDIIKWGSSKKSVL